MHFHSEFVRCWWLSWLANTTGGPVLLFQTYIIVWDICNFIVIARWGMLARSADQKRKPDNISLGDALFIHANLLLATPCCA